MATELKPCPFCGGKARMKHGYPGRQYSDDERIDDVCDMLECCHTVDAVEVVRCGKCKWWDPDSEYCQFWHGLRRPGHYCGEGEKK